MAGLVENEERPLFNGSVHLSVPLAFAQWRHAKPRQIVEAGGRNGPPWSTVNRHRRRSSFGPYEFGINRLVPATGRLPAPERAQRRAERLATPQRGLIEVAEPFDSRADFGHAEVAGANRFRQLLPGQRCRDRRTRA